jgi:hypothetical protein
MRPVQSADDLTTFICWLSWNLGASTSCNLQSLSRPVMRLLYLLLCHVSWKGVLQAQKWSHVHCSVTATAWWWTHTRKIIKIDGYKWMDYWWMKWHNARKIHKQVQPTENWLIIFKQYTLFHLLMMQHTKGRCSHEDINTTITNVYNTLFVHNYHTKTP